MREILFKAKRIDNGEWVEGSYIKSQPINEYTRTTAGMFVCNDNGMRELVLIDENTICQYTGLTDKNGNKIWENDVVLVTDDDGCSGQIDTGLGEIDFIEGLWYISGRVQNSLYDINKCFQIEVIGTKFDNPELLGG